MGGVSLAAKTLTEDERNEMLGGFFAGEDGNKRELTVGDKVEQREDTTFAVLRAGKEIASSLLKSPVTLLIEALADIGYVPFPDSTCARPTAPSA